MAFALRRPFALSNALKQLPSAASAARSFHSSPIRAFSKQKSPVSFLTKSRNGFHSEFRRTYIKQSPLEVPRPKTANLTEQLLYAGGVIGATVIATNFIFNRETREARGMPVYEREYLNDTFLHTGLGVGIIGVAAQALHRSGWSYRLMTANPWVVFGAGLAASIGTMYGCMATSPVKYVFHRLAPAS